MKSFARNYVWWLHLDQDIGDIVHECLTCQSNAKSPPAVPKRVRHIQEKQKLWHDQGNKERHFRIGDDVWAHNLAAGTLWLRGTVTACTGSSYLIQLEDHRTI